MEETYSFDERTKLIRIEEFIPETKWAPKQLDTLDSPGLYNELTYFHEYVRQVIYDFKCADGRNVMRYFEYDLSALKDNRFIIEYYAKMSGLPDDADIKDPKYFLPNSLTLVISSISLHLYNTGIGVLAFNLINAEPVQQSPAAILLINELGRRIYPQFLGSNGTWDTKRIFLADKITVGGISEDFSVFNDLTKFNAQNTFRPPAYIRDLFPDNVVFAVENNGLPANSLLITRVLDDRMFFLSWFGNREFADLTAKNWKKDDWWYAYIFGDKAGPGIADSDLMEQQLADHTYTRWSRYGTLFGLSRDSFVCLSADAGYFEKNDLPRLDIHMRSIYYQIAVLALVQRATVIKFSAEVAGLTDLARARHDNSALERIKDIYLNYIEFINKIYFREVTSQIQGIELYRQFQRVMRIEEDVRALDAEIQELHSYAEMVKQYQIANESAKQTFQATNLSKIATYFLPFSVVFGILGANIFSDQLSWIPFSGWDTKASWGLFTGLFISGIISYLVGKYLQKKG